MKRDIPEYLSDSFIDFKGDEHKVTLCALSQSPEESAGFNLMVAWSDGCEVDDTEDIYHDVFRALSIGVAICCPKDRADYTEEIGRKIALNRAEKAVPKFVSLEPGVINTKLVRAFLSQEMDYIKKYPEKFIKGYEEAKARYEKNLNLDKTVRELSNEEANIVQAAMDGIDIIKCAKLARQLLDRQIRELEKTK